MAKKATKKDLEKQIVELQNRIDTFTKENAELKAKIQFYENLPEQAGKVCNDALCMIMNAAFPSQKEQKQQ